MDLGPVQSLSLCVNFIVIKLSLCYIVKYSIQPHKLGLSRLLQRWAASVRRPCFMGYIWVGRREYHAIRASILLVIKVLKLKRNCKFEYLSNLGYQFHKGQCNVVNDKVWLCFHDQHNRQCKIWSEMKLESEIFYSNKKHFEGSLSMYMNEPFAFSGLFQIPVISKKSSACLGKESKAWKFCGHYQPCWGSSIKDPTFSFWILFPEISLIDGPKNEQGKSRVLKSGFR